MSVPGTLSLLLFAVCAVALPLFVGHGLSTHSTAWILAGVGFGVLAAVFAILTARLERRRDAPPH
jgi:membrane protein implicated in regulation of membrane protease activity